MVLQFDKCCFFIELRTGCLIIGYISLFFIFTMILSISMAAAGAEELKVAYEKAFLQPFSSVLVASVIFMSMVFMAFVITLLVGVHLGKRVLVKVYLIFLLVLVVLSVISLLVMQAIHFDAGKIVSDLSSLLINTYFLLVINSYYLKMEG